MVPQLLLSAVVILDVVCRAVFNSVNGEYLRSREYDTNIVPHLTIEISEIIASGGSMHASVKLEGIDGRAPQDRVEHVA